MNSITHDVWTGSNTSAYCTISSKACATSNVTDIEHPRNSYYKSRATTALPPHVTVWFIVCCRRTVSRQTRALCVSFVTSTIFLSRRAVLPHALAE